MLAGEEVPPAEGEVLDGESLALLAGEATGSGGSIKSTGNTNYLCLSD